MIEIYVKTTKINQNLVNSFFIIIDKIDKDNIVVTELEKFDITCEYFIRNNYRTVKNVLEVPIISLIEQKVDPKDYVMFAKADAQNISAKYDTSADVITFDDSTTAIRWNHKPVNGVYDLRS